MSIDHAVRIVAARRTGEDRACVIARPEGVLLVLADGAGGTSNGALAAQAIVDTVVGAGAMADACSLLVELDLDAARLGDGQSTAVIAMIRDGVVTGASVGDSGAWIVHADSMVDLTAGQQRKPLVGAGCAPWPIAPAPLGDGTLLVASDGLFRYATQADIARIVRGEDLQAAAKALVALVRLPTGALQDDVAVIVCRERA